MKHMSFSYKDSSILDEKTITEHFKKLLEYTEFLHDQIGNGYATHYGFINLPSDTSMQEQVLELVHKKKKLNPAYLIVCGIGGSNLGTVAIMEACFGRFYNTTAPMNVFFADTVDPHYIASVAQLIENALKQGKDILLNVITKSGTTTETIANFEIFLDLLKKYRPDNFADFVVAITDHGSPLYQLAQDNKFSVLSVPEKVGGRFSVFSAVGQFVLGMVDLNVKELLEGAQSGVVLGTSFELKKNFAAVNAIIKFEHFKQNQITLNDLFVFSVQLESFGKWYRQLMGESLGKEFDIEGNKVNIGITPTVSVGSIDLHSVGQLYLGGPYDKFITFLSVDAWKQAISVPKLAKFDQLVSKIQGKSLAAIMQAILEGVKIAYKKNKRPFCSLALPSLSPYYIGQLMQLYMLEIVYLGSLLQVNPFNQPNVESYKEETRKLL